MISRETMTILARKGRVEVIRTLRAFPDRDFSINELARVARIPTMTAWRSVNELKHAGFLKTKRVGNAVGVRISDDRDRQRTLRLVPETDPQRAGADQFAKLLGRNHWVKECRLFGSIGRGEHSPGDEVDVAVVFDEGEITEAGVKAAASLVTEAIKAETNVTIAPLFVPSREMSRRTGLASELRDKEVIWPV